VTLCSVSCKQDYEELVKIDESKKSAHISVVAQEVYANDIAIPVYAVGKVGVANETKLSFKIGGVVESLSLDEGDYVKEGKILAQLAKTEINAQYNKASNAYEKAKRDLARITNMYEDGAATLENVQDLTTLVDVTKSDLDIASFNQKYATIVSPLNGRIVKRLVEKGEVLGPGQPAFVIAGNGSRAYVLKTGVSDRDLNRIKVGDKATVNLDAYEGEIIRGNVSKIAESANPITGTFDIEINMRLSNKRVRNGYVGRCEITPTNQQSLMSIPIGGLVEVKDDKVLFYSVEQDSIAKEHWVNTVYIGKDFIYTDSEKSISKVIVKGAGYVYDGAIVELN